MILSPEAAALLPLDGMPVLARYVARMGSPLAGLNVLYINHLISDALMVARALRAAGADLWIVGVPYGDVDGPERRTIARGFAELGPTTVPRVEGALGFAAAMASATRNALHAIAEDARARDRRFMVVEDGGYAFPLLHDDPALASALGLCIGAAEHTSRGLWNAQFLEVDGTPATPRTLARPFVTIASSVLKSRHEPPFVAQAIVDELAYLLRRRHQFLRYRTVTVLGAGRVGLAIASLLAALDSEVILVEKDPIRGAFAQKAAPGLSVISTLDEDALLRSDVILGATGIASFTADHLRAFLRGDAHAEKRELILASASSKQLEFAAAVAVLEAVTRDPARPSSDLDVPFRVTRARVPGVGIDYRVELPSGRTRTVTLLADGQPTIFFPDHTHGAPNRPMDPIMTELYLASCLLAKNAARLPPKVHDLEALRSHATAESWVSGPWDDLMEEARILAAWCEENGIDRRSYFARRGIVGEGNL